MRSSYLDLQKDHQILQNIDLLKQSWRFVPKHLIAIKNQEKKGNHGGMHKKLKDKDAMYQQTTLQTINKNKNLYLAPVRDIQKIMKHFQKKFEDRNVNDFDELKNVKKNKKVKKRQSIKRTLTNESLRGVNGEQLIENKITKLLELPTIKRANSQAQKLKALSMQKSVKKQHQRQQILRKFQHYFSKQIDLINGKKINFSKQQINEDKIKRKRIKTSIQD